MPQGTPTPKVMGLATKLLLATWKISTRCRLGFVRYSSFRLALKIASAILPPSGNDRVTPATRVIVSSFAGPEGLIVEKVAPETPRFSATALSTAKPCTTTCVGKVVIPGMAIENVCATSVALPLRLGGGRGGTPTESPTSTVPARSVTMNPILLMPLGSVACTVLESPTSARDDTKCSTCGAVRGAAHDADEAARARARREGDVHGDGRSRERGKEDRVGQGEVAAGVGEADVLQAQVVGGRHRERQAGRDVLRVGRRLRQADGRRSEVPLDPARIARGLAGPHGGQQHASPPQRSHASTLQHTRSRLLLPGAGRHQVVDDVWRDQDQEVPPVLLL